MQSYRKAGLLLGNQVKGLSRSNTGTHGTREGSTVINCKVLLKSQIVSIELSVKCRRRHVWGNMAIYL